MADPFDALHEPVRPLAPDPRFAAELRARLENAILEPDGGTMPTTQATVTSTVTPCLRVSDLARAIEFYRAVFGAVRHAEHEDGTVDIAIGNSVISVVQSAEAGPGSALRIAESYVDGLIGRLVEHGGQPVGATTVRDPFGHQWTVTSVEQVRPAHGEVGNFTLTVDDDEAAKEFYGGVFGWRFEPGQVARAWGVEGAGLTMAGLWGGQRQSGWRPMYAVDDIEAATRAVRGHGGQASAPKRGSYGITAECADNQGIEFWLWQRA
ncbi:glyoxalase [Crossiella sp. SN42]|uniref:VOC family protein n=1 Tax=Crossiella sp. SN42 TaxID=2944808 RepID=UPI00207CFD5B|nr:VOC family protein [Crossiella sp. SN42]MCO1574628.1 glyoxalase [Crossiella sp. SN42]